MSYVILTILVAVVVIIGFQAFKNSEVVLFVDSFEFFLNCFIYIIPLILALGLLLFCGNKIDIACFLFFELSGFTGILVLNTYKNNRTIVTFLLAFVTKVFIGILSVIIGLLLVWIYIDRNSKDE